MQTQAYFTHIQAQIQSRLLAAETEIDLAVAWFTDRVLFDVLCLKATTGHFKGIYHVFSEIPNLYISYADDIKLTFGIINLPNNIEWTFKRIEY